MTFSNRQDLEHQVLGLLRRGMRQRKIARALGISRGVVQRVVRTHASRAAQKELPQAAERAAAPRASKLDPFLPRIAELLAQFPSITAQRIFEELRGAGYQGGVSILKERVHKLRPPQRKTPSLVRPPVGPGEEGEQDWSSHKIDFLAGGARVVHAFLVVLAHSRRRYLDFFEGEDLFALLEGHRLAFEYFRGVPRRIRYDNQKAVVARREGPDVFYHPRLLAFATHYGFEPYAVRPRRPNDKAIVERDLWDVERSFLVGRRFQDLDDLRAQARRWLDEIVDARRHPKRRDRTVREVFAEEEQPALVPLPAHAFDTARVVYRLVSIDGFVAWDGNRYSVPYEHVTALVPVRITRQELFVYGPDLACIAQHALLQKGQGREQILDGHRPPRPSGPGAHVAAIREPFVALCDGAAEYLAGLERTHPRSAAYHARRILELRERYSADDVAAALAHALRFSAFSFGAVTRIVLSRARPRTLDEYVAAETEDRLRGLLDRERTRPRDLATYDLKPRATDGEPPPAKEPPCPEPSPPTKPPSKPE
jgi:transposase